VGGDFGDHNRRLLDCCCWLGLTLLVELVEDLARVAPNKRRGFFPTLKFVLLMGNELDCGRWLRLTLLEALVEGPTRVAPDKGCRFFPSLLTGNEGSVTLRRNRCGVVGRASV